jgi:hypothetical protein
VKWDEQVQRLLRKGTMDEKAMNILAAAQAEDELTDRPCLG